MKMHEHLKLAEHQKTAAHHMYVGFAAGVIVTAGIVLLVFAFYNGLRGCEGLGDGVGEQLEVENRGF